LAAAQLGEKPLQNNPHGTSQSDGSSDPYAVPRQAQRPDPYTMPREPNPFPGPFSAEQPASGTF
jgi:hypothetical protein